MTHADWHQAMLNEPTDDLVRLAFADWLEEQGEEDRAAWVRVSVTEAGRAEWDESNPLQTGAVALRRVWPAEFGPVTVPENLRPVAGVTVWPDRGRVILRPPAGGTLEQLVDAPWLPAAVAAGWVGAVEYDPVAAASSAPWPAAWVRRPGLPWSTATVGPAVGVLSDALPFALDCPTLVGFGANAAELRPAVLDRLLTKPTLRALAVRTVSYQGPDRTPADEVRAVFERVGAAPYLRGVGVTCTDTYPTADDLLAVARNPALRQLTLTCYLPRYAPLADAVRAARPDLAVVTEGWYMPKE